MRLQNARKKTMGSKQTLKAIQRRQARVVYLALDAEKHILAPLRQACVNNDLPIIEVDSMQVLGKTCGIDVGCAAVAIIED
jgi:large subunit ribosomal protein L7A